MAGRAAHPQCELLANGHQEKFAARPTEGEDRARSYALAEGHYAGSTTYALKTDGAPAIQVIGLTPA